MNSQWLIACIKDKRNVANESLPLFNVVRRSRVEIWVRRLDIIHKVFHSLLRPFWGRWRNTISYEATAAFLTLFSRHYFASLFTNKTLKYPCTRYEDMRSWGMAPLILYFRTRWGKRPAVRLRLGGSHCRSGCFGEDIISCLCRDWNHDALDIQLVAQSNQIRPSRLLESNRRCITWNTESVVRWITNKLSRIPAELLNLLTQNDLQRRRAESPLKIKIPSKNMHN
jgi:hypothetical protein